jgi:excisionase family DNA binding protein
MDDAELDRSVLLSPEDVARRCGLSRRAVYRAIDRGELAASRLCHRLRVRQEDLAAWLDRTRVSPRLRPTPSPPPAPTIPGGLRRLLDEK